LSHFWLPRLRLMKSSWMYFTLKVTRLSSLYSKFFCSALLAKGLFKDPTVWLDGARPANTLIHPTVHGNVPAQLRSILAPKNTFASIRNYHKFGKIILFLFLKSQRKSLTNVLFATVSLSNVKFGKVKNLTTFQIRLNARKKFNCLTLVLYTFMTFECLFYFHSGQRRYLVNHTWPWRLTSLARPSGPNVIKLFTVVICKCLLWARVFSPPGLSSLVQCLRVRPEPTKMKHLSGAPP